MPLDLYTKIKKTLSYSVKLKSELTDVNKFIELLPHKMKVECSMYIYESRYSGIKFFFNQSSSFIAWICPLLKPWRYDPEQYIYIEGEEIKDIMFMIDGSAAFVLPSYKNCRYITIENGDNFGFCDIIGSVS